MQQPRFQRENDVVAWWALQDLNLGPIDYESTALTAELRALSGVAGSTVSHNDSTTTNWYRDIHVPALCCDPKSLPIRPISHLPITFVPERETL
jgi:hypothetical protein